MSAIKKVSERFTEADVDHEIVIMRLDNGEFFSLSGTAAEIWRLIDGERDRDALLETLARTYPGEDERISTDVDDFLTALRETGFLGKD